jgi:hypothetical protein
VVQLLQLLGLAGTTGGAAAARQVPHVMECGTAFDLACALLLSPAAGGSASFRVAAATPDKQRAAASLGAFLSDAYGGGSGVAQAAGGQSPASPEWDACRLALLDSIVRGPAAVAGSPQHAAAARRQGKSAAPGAPQQRAAQDAPPPPASLLGGCSRSDLQAWHASTDCALLVQLLCGCGEAGSLVVPLAEAYQCHAGGQSCCGCGRYSGAVLGAGGKQCSLIGDMTIGRGVGGGGVQPYASCYKFGLRLN